MSHLQPSADDTARCHVCVVGAGTMGRGIAQVALTHGHLVSLVDQDRGQLDAAKADIRARLARRRPDLAETLEERLYLACRVVETPAHGDTVIIEAVLEDIEVKGRVFAEAVDHFGTGCVLATNTSSLSVTEIAAQTPAPSRVVGMHFFNPVPVMKLVEVVLGLQTEPAVADRIADLATSWGKEVARVKSSPGFIVNRVARPFYGEALKLIEEGVTDTQTLDELVRCAGGFRMGPFELMDLIGNDVNFKVTRTVWSAFNFDPRFAPSRLQAEIVAAGRYGRKTGQGFYPYWEGADAPAPEPASPTSTAASPEKLVMHGEGGQLNQLLSRAGADHRVVSIDAEGPDRLELGNLGHVMHTRGRTAQQEAEAAGGPVALLDLCLDATSVEAIAVTATDEGLLTELVNLLGRAGIRAYPVADTPGLVVARIVSMIINEAMEASLHQIASPDDIDTAMVLGTNYPLGPFAWSRRWSTQAVLEILDGIWSEYRDPRYRASQRLRATTRKAGNTVDRGA